MTAYRQARFRAQSQGQIHADVLNPFDDHRSTNFSPGEYRLKWMGRAPTKARSTITPILRCTPQTLRQVGYQRCNFLFISVMLSFEISLVIFRRHLENDLPTACSAAGRSFDHLCTLVVGIIDDACEKGMLWCSADEVEQLVVLGGKLLSLCEAHLTVVSRIWRCATRAMVQLASTKIPLISHTYARVGVTQGRTYVT